jgi:hypothetical protein
MNGYFPQAKFNFMVGVSLKFWYNLCKQ